MPIDSTEPSASICTSATEMPTAEMFSKLLNDFRVVRTLTARIERCTPDKLCRSRCREASRLRGSDDSAQVVFLDVVAERAEAHTQEFCGLHLDAAGALERLGDVAAFDLLDVRFEIEPRSGNGIGRRRRRRNRIATARVRGSPAAGCPAGSSASLRGPRHARSRSRARGCCPASRSGRAAPSPRATMPAIRFPICSVYFGRKCSASSGMSSRRSRSGGSTIGMTLMR